MSRRLPVLILVTLFLIPPCTTNACINYEDYVHLVSSAGWWYDPPQDIIQIDNTAYVVCGRDGLRLFDVSDPLNLIPGSVVEIDGWLNDGTYDGEFIYLADYYNGMHVIELTDPLHPTLLGSCMTPGSAGDVAVRGDWAFVTDGEEGLQVIDVSDPTAPVIRATHEMPGSCNQIEVVGDYVFVSDLYDEPLTILDVSDPLNPSRRDLAGIEKKAATFLGCPPGTSGAEAAP